MNLHPYDGVGRRFRHTDANLTQGVQVVGRVLGVSPFLIPAEVCYDLSFYSGGSGVFDRLAITLPAQEGIWELVVTAEKANSLEEVSASSERLAELRWLFGRVEESEESPPLHHLAITFINEERRGFQTPCDPSHRLLIWPHSDVNSWAVYWGNDGVLNYLASDEG